MFSRLFKGFRKEKEEKPDSLKEPAWKPMLPNNDARPGEDRKTAQGTGNATGGAAGSAEPPQYLSEEDRMVHEWVAGLPSQLVPHGMIESYPRIAYRIAKYWSDPYKMQQYFNDLVFDNRGGRQGFPGVVAKEILALHQFYEEKLVESGMIKRPPTYL